MSAPRRLGRLSLRVDLHENQTLSSFLGALAAINGTRSAARFCKGFGLDYAGLCAGNPQALADLAQLAGVSAERLDRAKTILGPAGYMHGSELLDRNQLRPRIHVCPQCLKEAASSQPHLPGEVAVWERSFWRHSWIQSCADHHLRLVELPCVIKAHAARDMPVLVRNLERSGQALTRVKAEPSTVEIYIQQRYRGVPQNAILDNLPLSDALFLARYLGTPHGLDQPKTRLVGHDQISRWAGDGLLIAGHGWDPVREQLEEIAKAMNPHEACEIGLRRVFKSLFKRLELNTDPATLQLRQMLVDIGVEQNLFPFDQRDALGLPLPRRTLQSIESARRRFGISERILRATLEELGVAVPTKTERHGTATLVALEEVAPLLRELKDCLNLKQAASALGLLPMQLVKLSNQSGVLPPFFTRPSRDLKPLRYYRKVQISEFLRCLTAHCRPVSSSNGLVDIWEAGLRSCRQPAEVITAIHDGRIARTYSVGKIKTVRDLLVDVEDVRIALAEESGDQLVSAEDCAHSLSVNVLAARRIMQSGLLKAEESIHPVNRRRQLAVRQSDLAEFSRTFISLTEARQQWGTTAPGMANALFRAGVRPAFPLAQTSVGLYRRSEVVRAEGKLEAVMAERSAKYGGWCQYG